MKRLAAALALIALNACADPEVARLQAEVLSLQSEVAELTAFVDAQAMAITVCHQAMYELSDFLINKSTMGMFREAGAQMDRMKQCGAAMEALGLISRVALETHGSP